MYLLINSHTNKENFNKTLNRIQFFQNLFLKFYFRTWLNIYAIRKNVQN